MNTILVCFVVALSVISAVPVGNLNDEALLKLLSEEDEFGRNSALENIVINVLEDLRGVMVTGTDDIPVLDPFFEKRVFVDDSIVPIPGAYLELIDLTVSKLSTFEVNTVSISSASIILQRYNVELDVEVPAIDIDVGNYDLSVNAGGMSLFGAGDAKIVLVKPRIKANLLVGIRLGLGAIYLNIMDTRIEFTLADIQPAIAGMFHDPTVDGFVNLFLRNLVLELLNAYSEILTETISPIVQNIANDILSELNLISILG